MMFAVLSHIFVYILFLCVPITSSSKPKWILRIYSTLTEVLQPLDQLPLEFSLDEWDDIRSDSITLVGNDLNITSQTITEKKRTLNGAQVYIRSPISIDKTSSMFVKATLVDENKYLVKVQDDSMSTKDVLYFTVSPQDIFYMEEPINSKFYVDFTYNTSNAKILVSYLRSDIYWRTQYQLNLHDNQSDLIAIASIRNDGNSSVSVDQAELFSGDINIRMQRQRSSSYETFDRVSDFSSMAKMSSLSLSSVPTVGQGNELAGVYFFSIDKSFTIDAKTSYLLPMFRPHVSVERYGSITKSFVGVLTNGKAQRSYRLRSDRYISQGTCIIRENDRIVGEVILPNLAAKDKYEFSIGQDAEIIYTENVTLISSTKFMMNSSNSYSTSTMERTRYVYEIQVQVNNLKKRAINVEYTQIFSALEVKLVNSNNDTFVQESSSVNHKKIALNANDKQVYSYTIQLISY